MIFHPQILLPQSGAFRFSGTVDAIANRSVTDRIFSEFWHNFTYLFSDLNVKETDEMIFSVGKAERPSLDGYAYAIRIEETGFCIVGRDAQGLIHGYMTLLDRIRAVETDAGTALSIDCCEIKDSPRMQNRMVHFCIFPETELWELQRFLRLCGALRFSHVILEFWGMLHYDCMKELAWSHAFTKETLRPILDEARALGLEIVPMFNHWGHASAGRVMHGKHVVLDQNPSLQTCFSDDGWCWNIESPRVRALLRKIRAELTELCGDGSYFHIGCDEAYNFDLSTEGGMNAICDFMNEIAEEMASCGRRIIVWGDMFLFRHPHYTDKYTCNAPLSHCEAYMLNRLDKRIVIADWQYDATRAPVETSE
ncbi:MAG: family 20 glycosylhydrolase, partial [Clostridia bacterium]|nr:family 20 glycosylhydrolase [Clostridia bacterium]